MARTSIWLKTFTRDADFVVGNKSFLFNGEEQRPGEPFDKTKVTTRQLRAFYEQRKINMVPKAEDQPIPPTDGGATGEGIAPDAGGQVEPPAVEQPETVDDGEGGDEPEDTGEADENRAYVKHIGRGTYGVFIGNSRMAGPLTKDEAQAEADKLNG